MELNPNEGHEGKYKYPEKKAIGWVLKVRLLTDFPGDEKGKGETYIQSVLDAIGFEVVPLCTTDLDD